MKVLVCGGRDFQDRDRMDNVLRFIDRHYETMKLPGHISEVIHGGAPGADTLASEWASGCGVPVALFPANWKQHGRAAGPIRNQQMLDECKPDLVVAFPGGRGTADMVRRAKASGVRVYCDFSRDDLPHTPERKGKRR
jgi:hypothetical protein